jgi:hypothetical protein
MSTPITFPIIPQVGSWTLAGTLRFVNDSAGNPVAIETAPQSVLADSEFETTETASGSSMGSSWLVQNLANCTSIDANTTEKSKLVIVNSTTSTNWAPGTLTGPYVYQSIGGNFDVFCRIKRGVLEAYDLGGLMAQDQATPGTIVSIETYGDISHEVIGVQFSGQVANSSQWNILISLDQIPQKYQIGGFLYLRLVRSSGNWAAYYSWDMVTWMQVGPTEAMAMIVPCNLGPIAGSANTNGFGIAAFDFVRNTAMFDTTSPVASVILDSALVGTSWNMSTFQDYLFPVNDQWAPYFNIGLGNIKYQFGSIDVGTPTLNGTWLTTSQMQSQGTVTGRFFKLAVQFNCPNSYNLAYWSGATIQGTQNVTVSVPANVIRVQRVVYDEVTV